MSPGGFRFFDLDAGPLWLSHDLFLFPAISGADIPPIVRVTQQRRVFRKANLRQITLNRETIEERPYYEFAVVFVNQLNVTRFVNQIVR